MNRYFYRDEHGNQCGPIEEKMFSSHDVGPDTLIWKRGMQKWVRAIEVVGPGFWTNSDNLHARPQSHNFGGPNSQGAKSGPQEYETNHMGSSSFHQRPTPPPPPSQFSGNNDRKEYSTGPTQTHPTTSRPNNYLVWSILLSVFCGLLPVGCIALYYSLNVNKDWDSGRYQKAEDDAKKAKIFLFIQMGLGIIMWIVFAIVMLAVIGDVASSPEYYNYY